MKPFCISAITCAIAAAASAAPGDVDMGFDPNAVGEVDGLAVEPDGKIVAGGFFTLVGGASRPGVARLQPNGTPDAGFNPMGNGVIRSAGVQTDGRILLTGSFTSVSGVSRRSVARVNADGTLDAPDPSFNPGPNDIVRSIALQSDGRILIGGNFTVVAGALRHRVARLNADGTLDTAFDPNADDIVFGVFLQADGKVLIDGRFGTVNPNLPDSTSLPAWQLSDDDYILTFSRPANVRGITCVAECSTSLTSGSWTAIPNSSTPPQYAYYAPAGIGQRLFLRMRVTVP